MSRRNIMIFLEGERGGGMKVNSENPLSYIV